MSDLGPVLTQEGYCTYPATPFSAPQTMNSTPPMAFALTGTLSIAQWYVFNSAVNVVDPTGVSRPALLALLKLLRNKIVTDPATGAKTIYDDDNATTLCSGTLYKDVAGTIPFDGTGANRQNRLASAALDDMVRALPTELGTVLATALKLLRNKTVTDPSTGVMTVYDDNGTDVLMTANLYKDAAGTAPFDGTGANRRNRLA
jgi:hypothetical protein